MKELTELQWAKEGYVLNENATGVERWTNRFHSKKARYYNEDEVHLNTDAAKKLLSQKNKEYQTATKINKERLMKSMMFREKMKTKWQWLQEGRIPNRNAEWRLGEELNETFKCCAYGSRYLYCNIDETHIPESDQELEEAKQAYLNDR